MRLNHKDPIPTRARALLDRIARIQQRVQTRIAPETELCQRDVIADRRRQMDHGDMQRGVRLPRLIEYQERVERLEPANQQQPVKFMFLEPRCNSPDIDIGQGAVRAEFGPAARSPVVHFEPCELGDVVFEEAFEAVVDREGRVAVVHAVARCCAGCCVHAAGGGADAASAT